MCVRVIIVKIYLFRFPNTRTFNENPYRPDKKVSCNVIQKNIDNSGRVELLKLSTIDTGFQSITHTNQHSTITQKIFCVLLRRQLFSVRWAGGGAE